MAVSVEAFLVLEKSLASRLSNAWRRDAAKPAKEISRLVERGEFEKAVDLCEELSLGPSAERNRQFAEFVGRQAVLFGASRLTAGNPNRTTFAGAKTPEHVERAAQNLITTLEFNATESVCRRAITMLGQERADQQEASYKAERRKDASPGFVGEFESFVRDNGDAYINVGSSLHTSRLASWGFTVEATARGIENYQISEQLDSRTCPVCRNMDGKTFSVQAAREKLESQLATTNPNELKSIASWPKQDKASVARLGKMSNSELQDNGWNTPPFHPLCRGVLVESGSIPASTTVSDQRGGIPDSVRAQPDTLMKPIQDDLVNATVKKEQYTSNVLGNISDVRTAVESTDPALFAQLGKLQDDVIAARKAGATRGEIEDLVKNLGLNKNGNKAFGNKVRGFESYVGEGGASRSSNTIREKAMFNDLSAEHQATWDSLTEDEKGMEFRWRSRSHEPINDLLRNGEFSDRIEQFTLENGNTWGLDELAEELIEDFDFEFEDMATLRKMVDEEIKHLDNIFKKTTAMEYDTFGYRAGVHQLPDDLNDLLGTVITDNGYKAVSAGRSYPDWWITNTSNVEQSVMYKIKIPKGSTNTYVFQPLSDELELMIKRGSKVRVTGYNKVQREIQGVIHDLIELEVELLPG